MRRQLRPAVVLLSVLGLLTGLAYPLAVTGIAQLALSGRANGSTIRVDGAVVGSSALAQPFEGDDWFQPRPSAVSHDASTSGGSNLGPSNPALLAAVADRADAYRVRNRLPAGFPVPVDAVTASGSGLDPHISPRNARLQAPRVADSRGLELDTVAGLVDRNTSTRALGLLGEHRVNVVTLNADLARLGR